MSSEPADRSLEGGTSARTHTIRELFRSPYAFLAVGVLLLEFSAGVTVYVTTAVLPAAASKRDFSVQAAATISTGVGKIQLCSPDSARTAYQRPITSPPVTTGSN